jgi:hypothetical protein
MYKSTGTKKSPRATIVGAYPTLPDRNSALVELDERIFLSSGDLICKGYTSCPRSPTGLSRKQP